MGNIHGHTWTDDKIKQAVRVVVNAYELDRMPSKTECERYCGNYKLSNAISRRGGGWYALAKELGLPIKKSDTYFGKSQEGIVCEMLISKGFEVERMPQNFPYDILVDNSVKIDVKASHLYHGKQGNFFTFNLEKKYATCDIYVLLTLDDNNNIINTFIVPSKFVIKNTQISIGEYASKYHKYRDRWDYISNLFEYFASIG